VPGSLKPPMAYCMLLLANPRHSELLLDPMCGAGTILLETEGDWSPRLLVGADLNSAIIAQARINFEQARNQASLVVANAFQLPLPNGSVDRIACNLPWGRQVSIGEDSNAFHTQLVGEFTRVLRPAGRAVLLTDQVSPLLASLTNQPGIYSALTQQISLFGSHPTILMMTKQPRKPDLLHPFIQYRDEDETMTPVVHAALLASLSHPDPALRLQAAQACLRSKDEILRQTLATLANDPVPQIRDIALKLKV
jgi:tRNA (guanine6-N2)-methyltransferase